MSDVIDGGELTVAGATVNVASGRAKRARRGKGPPVIGERQLTGPASQSTRQATAPITIVLADDQTLVRRGIRCLLELEEDFKVVGEASDGTEVVSLVERLKPRMVIVASAMPGLDGLEITRLVSRQSPAPAVIVLSMYSKEQYVIQALRNGATGYVVTDAKPAELMRAIRRVVAGHHYLSEPLSKRPIATWLQRAKRVAVDAYKTLTSREHEVLLLVAEGYSNARIADRLHISRRTAESHRASVMHKLRFRNQIDLVRYVLSRAGGPPC